MIEPERKFIKVERQILGRDFVVDAHDAAFDGGAGGGEIAWWQFALTFHASLRPSPGGLKDKV